MYVILAHPGDEVASAVCHELILRYGAPHVALLSDEELTQQTVWAHWQEGNNVRTTLCLADGRRLESADLTAVFNRLRYLTMPHFNVASVADHDYAISEMFALLLSCLASLACPVINPVSRRSLGGADRSLFEWLRLAGRVGLPTRGAQFTTNARIFSSRGYWPHQPPAEVSLSLAAAFPPVARAIIGQSPTLFLEPLGLAVERMLVIGDTVCGRLPELNAPCLRLARLSQTSLLECFFARSEGDARSNDAKTWRFCWANSFPSALSSAEVSALADLLAANTLCHRPPRY
jgi:hypothetical protein